MADIYNRRTWWSAVKPDPSYSPDVEIGADGKLYYARDVSKGEVISIPMHMIDKAHRL